ncbi:uncharacterized protein BX663DRAFT_526204 [Cokeromyces recurvatus]|uniref:uncharacterized protein n=1 Tax=Cokeromyces recurvatus TaxID=90255 RepID=UPI0022212A55|nr:uncharacterized protein BX663DRAFT_526204 [Cokeromyces recurvatus]KAI7898096.1 hypothetical protein BX663DRAFT_526204 [Cokeromyces recurvatus]
MRISFPSFLLKATKIILNKPTTKKVIMNQPSTLISEEEMNSLQEAFSLYDTNKNGAISLEHFASILKSLNIVHNDNNKVKSIVQNLDKNNDGQIDFEEFVNAMTQLLLDDNRTLRKWKTFPNDDDKKQKNKMDSQHYSRRMSKHEADDLKLCFGKFDKNGDGLISEDELKEVMKGLGENLSNEEIKDMMKDADANQDGYIDFEEFKALIPTNNNE